VTEQEWLASTGPREMLDWLCQQGRGERDRKEWRDGRGRGCGYRASDRKLRLLGCAAWRQYHERLDLRLVEAAEEWADGKIDRDTAVCRVAGLAPREPHHTLFQPEAQHAAGNAEVNCRDKALFIALVREVFGNPFQDVGLPYHSPKGMAMYRPGDPVQLDSDARCFWLTPIVISLATAAYEERERVCARCKGEKRVSAYSGMYRLGSDPCEDCCGTGRLEDGLLDGHRFAVLADALEDAGCNEGLDEKGHPSPATHLLRHLRDEEWVPRPACDGNFITGGSVQRGLTNCARCRFGRVWRPLSGIHVRGCWALDLLLGKE
jgi:hypothetical protein